MTSQPVTVTRHQCPHCRRTWAKQPAADRHVARCWRNPETRGCKTCTHLAGTEEGPYPEHPGWPESCDAERDIRAGLVTGCPLWTTTDARSAA